MKLVSVNAILLGTVNVSLFAKIFFVQNSTVPLTLFILSFIYIDLIVLLEYEHRRFEKVDVNMHETTLLIRNYFHLFSAGLILTLLHKFELQKCNQYIVKYVLMGGNLYYSMLYYLSNLVLGNLYLHLFKKEYQRANREKIPSQICMQVNGQEICSICQYFIKQKQNIARIACMHIFHSQCLHKWAKKKSLCPTCKTPIQLV